MLLGARVRLLVEEDGAVAGERELVVEDLEELGIEGVRDVVDDDPDGPCPPRDQGPRGQVRRVVHLAGRLEHAGHRPRGDPRVAAERPRHGRLADPEPAGDVLARHCHGGSMADGDPGPHPPADLTSGRPWVYAYVVNREQEYFLGHARAARADAGASRSRRCRRDGDGVSYRLGVDVGGTFTDVVLYDSDDQRVWLAKTPSTPGDQSVGVIDGIRLVADRASV